MSLLPSIKLSKLFRSMLLNFGFIGLIFGPLLISLFMLLVRIYSSEFIPKQMEAVDVMEN